MLDEHAGSSVGALRHNGFLKGFGDQGQQQTDRLRWQRPGQVALSAMENCLQKNLNIDVVYTINEPSAAGAWTALKKALQDTERSHDRVRRRGCAGVRKRPGLKVIDATSQQYPLKMAALGVTAVVNYAKGGKKPSGYTDTGVNLIAKKAVAGVASKGVAYGLNCWG